MRQDWTDDRLDDFRAETKHRFDEVDKRFDEVDKRFDKLETELKDLGKELHRRFDALQRAMLQFSGTVVLALVALMATQL